MTCYLALTFHSPRYDHLTLRRLVRRWMMRSSKCRWSLKRPSSGVRKRQVRVLLDPVRLASRNLSPAGLVPMLQQRTSSIPAGKSTSDNHKSSWKPGVSTNAEDVGNGGGRRLFRQNRFISVVATSWMGAEEPSQYVFFGPARRITFSDEPAVTLSIPNGLGNAILRCPQVLEKSGYAEGYIIPADVRSPSRATTVDAEDKFQ